jgi:kynureninase
LQPPNAPNHIDEVMNDWANLAVEGHFMLINLGGIITCALQTPFGVKIEVGSLPSEVTVMSNLTAIYIYHYYRPTKPK